MRIDHGFLRAYVSIRAGVVTVLAAAMVLLSLTQLEGSKRGLVLESMAVGDTPVTVHRTADAPPAPAIVIAHGFAGSQALMQPIALSLAQKGYVAVSFDFLGHGGHPAPMTGDITREEGATRALLAQLETIIAFARDLPAANGEIALLAHSMGSDIIVRAARRDPAIAATIAVSMFSREVTATEPRNLLMIVGGWEGGLKAEALRQLGLGREGQMREGEVREAVTYGEFADGSARRVAFADHVEHVGVLYSPETMREAGAWLDAVFGQDRPDRIVSWGPWLGLLLSGLVVIAWPLSKLLPPVQTPEPGPGMRWQRFLVPALLPALLTPVILTWLPIRLLPVLVADYLALHFGLYGLLTAAVTLVMSPQGTRRSGPSWPALAIATVLVTAFGLVAIIGALDRYITALWPTGGRWPVLAIMALGMLLYFLADEWLTRRAAPGGGRYLATKLAFLASLVLAIALDLERLFFLILIFPAIILYFLTFGLISGWVFRATGHPLPAAIASAAAFAIALAGSFPMVEG